MGIDWHRDAVLGSWTDNPEPSPGLVKEASGSQQSEGVVDTSGVISEKCTRGVSLEGQCGIPITK